MDITHDGYTLDDRKNLVQRSLDRFDLVDAISFHVVEYVEGLVRQNKHSSAEIYCCFLLDNEILGHEEFTEFMWTLQDGDREEFAEAARLRLSVELGEKR